MKRFNKTKSVDLLLNEFRRSDEAQSAVELVKVFQADMNKTTVYRILERLEEKGILHSFSGKDGLKWYAKYAQAKGADNNHNHPHFQCDVCGKSECLSIDFSIASLPNYKIETVKILLTGHCSDCISSEFS